MNTPLVIVSLFFLYVGILFFIGYSIEKNERLRLKIQNSSFIYALSLTVFITSWTFYGSVGFAADYGMLFLTFYLGPTISASLWLILLQKFIRIRNEFHITSIADFVSARYGKSHIIAAVVTIIVFVGIIPYVALQLRSIISTLRMLICTVDTQHYCIYKGPFIVILMIVFTILLGVRRVDPTERHPGVIGAIAFEGIVKLVAFLSVGIFVTFFLFEGFEDIFTRMRGSYLSEYSNLFRPGNSSITEWFTRIGLSMSAFLFLPRQFHVAVIENKNEKHVKTAVWLVPLYMLIITFFTFPIAIGGLMQGYLPQEADTFVLKLPLENGQPTLALFAFIGGFSAATGMIIISSMTMATMITNHIVVPMVAFSKRMIFIKRHLLQCRWIVVTLFLFAGYIFEQYVARSMPLVAIGTYSFAAIIQLAPAILGGIFWRRGNVFGCLAGLISGFFIWFYTAIIPMLIKSGFLPLSILSHGPFQLTWLRPERLFGVSILDPLTHCVVWSLGANILIYIIASLLFDQTREEQSIANAFIDSYVTNTPIPFQNNLKPTIALATKLRKIKSLLLQYFTPESTNQVINVCFNNLKLIPTTSKLSILDFSQLCNEIEKKLTGVIGASAAHKVIKDARLFTANEAKELSSVYADILTELNITPDEMRKKINYYQEREILLMNEAATLEELVKKRTQQLEKIHDELIKKEKLATLGKLTATVSHELRNPLGTIRSSLYSLAKRLKNQGISVDNILERAERNVERCDIIIDELLDYTKSRELDLRLVILDEWIDELISEVSIPKFITLKKNLKSAVSIKIDQERIQRCILNLITNAIQSMQDERKDKANAATKNYKLTIETKVTNGMANIDIQDNGQGISRDLLKKVFEPLFSTKNYGVGLGLSIVKQIIEQHSGSIIIDSDIGKGTFVSLRLPLKK